MNRPPKFTPVKLRVWIIAAALLAPAAFSVAQNVFTYQGRLADSTGTPLVDGPYDMQFSLYDSAAGPTVLWTETQAGVPVVNGQFSAPLGSVTAIADSLLTTATLYLEVAVETNGSGGFQPAETFTPRIEIRRVPWASLADNLRGQLDAAKVSTGVVSDAEFDALDGITGNIQAQIDAHVATFGLGGHIPATGATDAMVADSLTINGGSVNNSPIGLVVPASVRATTLTATTSTNLQNGPLLGAQPLRFEGPTQDAITTNIVAADVLTSQTIVLPNASGTFAVSATAPLALDANGNLTYTGGSGGPDVTLAPGLDTVLDVDGSQLLSLDPQADNVVFAGPNGGGPAEPTFRALTDGDVPDALTIQSGTINLTPIGATTASTGRFTIITGTQRVDISAATMDGASPMRFEGATNDNNETFINVVDPSADRDIFVPDASGTLAVSATAPLALDAFGNLTVSGLSGTNSGDVTLGPNVDGNLLGLTAQALELDDQAAFLVFAGPAAAGPNAAPSFRALGDDDIPDNITITGLSGTNTGDVALTAAADSSLLDLSGQTLGLDSQGANSFFAAPDGAAGTPGFRAILDSDIPDNITITGLSGTNSGDVTLGPNVDGNLLDLTAQALELDDQAAFLVFAGPAAAGPNAAPSFRALGDDDIPDNITITGLSGTNTGDVALTAAADSSLLDLSGQTLGLDSQGANSFFAAPDGAAGTPGFRAILDSDIPDNITITGLSGSNSGDVTLTAAADSNLLDLSGQTVGLDSQSANFAFVAPDGANGTPSFRALLDGDIPNAITMDGGSVNNSPIGNTTPSSGIFTSVESTGSGRFDGPVFIDDGASEIIFEGATNDAFETIFGVVDPTGARAINLPDGSGTVAVSATAPLALDATTGNLTVSGLSGTNSGDVTLNGTIDSNLLSLTGQELNLDTQGANQVFIGPQFGGPAAPSFRALQDDDIPNNITVDNLSGVNSGDVSLGVNAAANLLELTAQSVELDDQAAFQVFAGPAVAGPNAAPSFRALSDDDIPNNLTVENGTVNDTVIGGTTPASGTFTNLNANTAVNVGAGVNVIFEGSTVDANDTFLGVVNPTVPRAVNLPDASGTVAVSAVAPLALDATTGELTIAGFSGTSSGTNTGDVTLSADANSSLLSLTGQDIGIDNQNANTVLAGPASPGPAGVPVFRTLTDADIPNDITLSTNTGINVFSDASSAGGSSSFGLNADNGVILIDGVATGAGATNLQRELTVDGDALFSGDVRSGSFNYTAAQVRYISLAPGAFVPIHDAMIYNTSTPGALVPNFSGANAQGISSYAFRAQLHLPDGATVTGGFVECRDDEASGREIRVFFENSANGGTSTPMSGNTAGTPGNTTFNVTGTSFTIDNQNRAYYVTVVFDNQGGMNAALFRVRVQYQVNNPD